MKDRMSDNKTERAREKMRDRVSGKTERVKEKMKDKAREKMRDRVSGKTERVKEKMIDKAREKMKDRASGKKEKAREKMKEDRIEEGHESSKRMTSTRMTSANRSNTIGMVPRSTTPTMTTMAICITTMTGIITTTMIITRMIATIHLMMTGATMMATIMTKLTSSIAIVCTIVMMVTRMSMPSMKAMMNTIRTESTCLSQLRQSITMPKNTIQLNLLKTTLIQRILTRRLPIALKTNIGSSLSKCRNSRTMPNRASPSTRTTCMGRKT